MTASGPKPRGAFAAAAILVAAAALAVLPPSPARACEGDVPASAVADMRAAQQGSGDADERAKALVALSARHPASFCLLHEAARHLMRAEDDVRALGLLATLERRWPDADADAFFGETPYNTRGFAAIKLGRLDPAVEDLRRQIDLPGFETVAPDQRMKVHNNLGYALLKLERYQEALVQLEAAAGLGSVRAQRNIEAARSILHVLAAGDPDLPGVFAVVVETSRSYTDISRAEARLASAGFGDAEGGFRVFQRDDGKLSLTVGANESWPRAEARLATLRPVVPDAFITSTANWRELTAGIQRGLSVKPRRAPRPAKAADSD